MRALMTAAMSIPGHIDPVTVPRPEMAAAEGARVNLIGLSKAEIREALAEAGLDERQARLRAKQLWHQIYNRGATRFETMSDIAKPQRAWFAERFEIAPARSGGRAGLDRRHPQMAAEGRPTATISRWCSSRTQTAAHCASRARSAAH